MCHKGEIRTAPTFKSEGFRPNWYTILNIKYIRVYIFFFFLRIIHSSVGLFALHKFIELA